MADRNAPPSGTEHPLPPRSKSRVLAELLVSYGLILVVIWTPRPWQKLLWWVAAASVVLCTCISFDGLQAMGLRGKNFLRSFWIAGAALLLAISAMVLAAQFHTLRMPPGIFAFIQAYWAYALWAGVQQFLLQCFFLLRFRRLIPSPRSAAVAAAGIFALAHLPNPILTPITLLWGLAACLLFLRYRNLYLLAIAHAIFGITVAITVPGPVDHNMRVGLGYLRYGHRPHPTPYALPHPAPQK
jgi:hypothetical protein